MAKTISQRISLEGSEDIRKKLEELGKTGEQAFKTIQDAAKKPIADAAQIDRTKQAIDQLVQAGTNLQRQFAALTGSAQQFGAAGSQATAQVTAGLDQTTQAAQQTGQAVQMSATKFGLLAGAVAGATQAVATKLISLASQLQAAFSPSALTKGVVDTATKISDAADKIGASAQHFVTFRKAALEAGVSAEDFVKSLEKAGGVLDKAKGGVAQLGQGVSELSTFSNNGTVTIMRFNDAAAKLTTSANTAATELAKLGISTRAAAMPEGMARFRQLADEISRMPNATQRAAAGVAVFGKNWEKVVEILRTGQRDIDNTKRSLAEAGKANRELSGDAVEAANKLGESWKDLQEAIRATKDLIGSIFVGGAQTRADWLIALVDGSRELLRTWLDLAETKKDAFLASLGDSPAEFAFKTLIALGKQLSAVWNEVLVPAGYALWNVLADISRLITGSKEGLTKSQAVAFFITLAGAAVTLTLALKGIQFVLVPLMALFSPFGAVLLAAGVAASRFWGVLAAGAQRVAALIPNSLALIQQAIRNLFAGNFAAAWAQFSEGATAAFGTIAQAAVRAQGPIGAIARGIAQVAKDFPGAIKVIVAALIGLAAAATGVADTINAIFGTKLTGTDIALLVIVLQLTGALSALASIATVVGVAINVLIGIFGGLATAIILGTVALITYMGWWPQVSAAAKVAIDFITVAWQIFVGAFQNGLAIISSAAQATWDFLKPFGGLDQAVAAIWNSIVQTVVGAWEAIKQAGVDAMASVQGAIDGVIGMVNALISAIGNAIQSLLKLIGLGGGPGGRGATGSWATGGMVGGRGTGTSDSNLAWVSRGEHIMPARAVRQPGVLAFLEALRRSGGNLSRVLDGMGRFARGGLLPRFADGGMVGSSNVTIQFPGLPDIGGLRAAPSAVDQLRRAAVMAQVRSGGRKPSRYG